MRTRTVILLLVLIFVSAVIVYLYRKPAASPEESRLAAAISTGGQNGSRTTLPNRPASSKPPGTTPHDRDQLHLLEQILASRNDNDPRLDTELRRLSSGAKFLMEGRYQQFAPEARNDRGTVVFLIGRNLESSDDMDFMRSVLAEPPCRSLGDCSQEGGETHGEAKHLESTDEVTKAYPQLVALKSIENYLNQASSGGEKPPLSDQALAALQEAMRSPVPSIAQAAQALIQRYYNKDRRTSSSAF